MEDERRIFPKSSAFEALLAKVYLELWDASNTNPAEFAQLARRFVSVFLPSMFQKKIPDFSEKVAKMEANIAALEKLQSEVDPLTSEEIRRTNIPEEEAALAEEVWHAGVDVLTEAGFNFPMSGAKPRRQMRA